MNTDSHFWIGSTHKICQDYALSGNQKGKQYAIVSDGCSSSPDTDWGSRFIAKAAERSIHLFPENPKAFSAVVASEARILCKTINLSQYALDATLLVAIMNEHEVSVGCYGDGAFAFIYPEYITIYIIDYESGAPFYLNYLNSIERTDVYVKEAGLNRYIQKIIIYPDKFVKEKKVSAPENITEPGFIISHSLEDIIAVAVMSDGVLSYMQPSNTATSRTQTSVPVEDIVKELLGFKGYAGVFVERRVQKFIKTCMQTGWHNCDDVSLAVICAK